MKSGDKMHLMGFMLFLTNLFHGRSPSLEF